MELETWHAFPTHDVEVGTGEPGYRWAPGFSALLPGTGSGCPARSRRDLLGDARINGARVVWHDSEAAARAARTVANV